MSIERGPTVTIEEDRPDRPHGDSASRWIYLAAALLELAAMILMTTVRYVHQDLAPDYLDLTKTANVVGLMFAGVFIAPILVAMTQPRLLKPGLAIAVLFFSATSLLLLILPNIGYDTATDRYLYVGYLLYKALELAFIVVTFSPRQRAPWQKVGWVIILTVLLTGGAYGVVIGAVLLDPVTNPENPSPASVQYDAGVILGAAVWSGNRPSPVLRERIQRGYELLQSGRVEFLVLTGGNAPGEKSEAEVARRELLAMGVDPTRIVLEEETSSTVEQIVFVREALTEQGWESFVIVSDQFHLKRALEIAAFNGIKAGGVPSESPLGPNSLGEYYLRESAALTLYWLFGV